MEIKGSTREIISFLIKNSDVIELTSKDTFAINMVMDSIKKTLTAKTTNLSELSNTFPSVITSELIASNDSVVDIYTELLKSNYLSYIHKEEVYRGNKAIHYLESTERLFKEANRPVLDNSSSFFNLSLRMLIKPLNKIEVSPNRAGTLRNITLSFPFRDCKNYEETLISFSRNQISTDRYLENRKTIKEILDLQSLILERFILRELESQVRNIESNQKLQIPMLNFMTY